MDALTISATKKVGFPLKLENTHFSLESLHIWGAAPSTTLHLLNASQKKVIKFIVVSVLASKPPSLAHR